MCSHFPPNSKNKKEKGFYLDIVKTTLSSLTLSLSHSLTLSLFLSEWILLTKSYKTFSAQKALEIKWCKYMKQISSQGYIFSKCGHDEMRTVFTYRSVHIGWLSIYFLPLNNIASFYFLLFLIFGYSISTYISKITVCCKSKLYFGLTDESFHFFFLLTFVLHGFLHVYFLFCVLYFLPLFLLFLLCTSIIA